ncbi:hypothetical protein TH63_19045 [Rufibacter radiotolerans]|uniref:Uncharacterized protein n=1 Tax=Rufibacter radiotolerans TaxID=1379910 RepID=A0A0H4W9V9_9BACT|nr:hypothetical protein TH63_19045 [Rufibacter radiotolerans]
MGWRFCFRAVFWKTCLKRYRRAITSRFIGRSVTSQFSLVQVFNLDLKWAEVYNFNEAPASNSLDMINIEAGIEVFR